MRSVHIGNVHSEHCTQSTLGAELAALLGVPFISLDTLFWLPGWAETPTDEFRTKVRVALDQDTRGWVVDGNYTQRLGTIVQNEATDIICKAISRLLVREVFGL